ncbi:aminopeptidase P family N-terminal domain-containing protein [Lapidilactobacillus dextrinicus]
MKKLEALQKWVQEQHLDVAYISDPNSVGYFTNFALN